MRRIIAISVCLCAMSIAIACTIGVFSGDATADGNPMLWKNRDVPNGSQQYIYVPGEHDFIGITYQGVINKVYGGMNDAGFGIVNTDTYNHGSWRSIGWCDGLVMFHALSTCETVWDFMDLLDSLIAGPGLRSTHCYGVMDELGNAIIVESSCTNYVYYSAASSPDGFLIRTNFALSGDDSDRRGWERYLRARTVLEHYLPLSYKAALAAARDLITTELDPNPLPFEGTLEGLPYGYISTEQTLNRYMTTSYQVIIGTAGTPMAIYPMMWSGFGQPYASVPVPLWISSGEVPPQMTGSGNSLCAEAQFIKGQIYDQPNVTYFDTYKAYMTREFLLPFDDSMFNWYESKVALWRKYPVESESLSALQNDMANMIGFAYEELRGLFIRENPQHVPRELAVDLFPNPFNSTLQIRLQRPANMSVEIVIRDISGRVVFRRTAEPDAHMLEWTPESDIASGIYLISAIAAQSTITSKAIFAR